MTSVIWPPTRNDVSVPGIRNDRGKLPAVAAAVIACESVEYMRDGPLFPACAIWSSRCWRSSLFARKSETSSAFAVGTPVSSATKAVAPPIAAMVPKVRFLVIAPPITQWLQSPGMRAWVCLGLWYRQGRLDQADIDDFVVFSSQRCVTATLLSNRLL